MNNIAIMYHYVRDIPGPRSFNTRQFRDQIRHLQKQYKMVLLSEIGEYHNDRQTCTLTFDDGLKDSVTTILPILQELSIPAVFFIPGSILDNDRILGVQKRHLLLEKIGSEALIGELNNILPEELQIRADPVFKCDYLDDLLTCSMKWMLDYADSDIMEPALDLVFLKYFPDEKNLFRDIYLSEGDLHHLIVSGMELGAHGYSHHQLGELYLKDQEKEIKTVTDTMKRITGLRPQLFSYPSGNYNPLTIRLLEKYQYRYGMTTHKHPNTEDTPRLELGRFDCIDIRV